MQTSADSNAGVIPGDRYHVVRVLKKGKHVETLLAIDAERGAAVVVKLVAEKSISRDAQYQLEREISVLGDVDIPHAAPPNIFRRDKQQLYLVRPFVPGITLRVLLQQGPLKIADVLTIGDCLFSALKAIHAHNVLHGDIRPANIIVAEGWPANGVVLVGFDLQRLMPPDLLSDEESIEVAKYRSPEQAGTLEHGVAAPSDFYSAGAVLFECLAGRAPYDGDNVGTLLFEHITGRVPELRSLGLEIPRALDEVIAQQIGETRHFRTAAIEGNQRIAIDVEVHDGVLHAIVPRDRITVSSPDIFILWMSGSSLILVGVAILFLLNQVRPIERLARAADAFGKGRAVPDFKPYGATEVRRAAQALSPSLDTAVSFAPDGRTASRRRFTFLFDPPYRRACPRPASNDRPRRPRRCAAQSWQCPRPFAP